MQPNDNVIIPDAKALLWTLLGVLGFSGSLPATRIAVGHLNPVTVGLGRAVVAAVFAALALALTRSPWPKLNTIPSLMVVVATVVLGFPLMSAFALTDIPASRGAVVLALAPLSTAVFAALRSRNNPGLQLWLPALFGAGAVLSFVGFTDGGFRAADLKLLVGALVVGLGYAEGARLSKRQPGWQVIAWALVLAAPLLAVVTPWPTTPAEVPLSAWLAFAYLSIISMFLGFVAWYSGLARGGIAKMGQLQLLQPFLTLIWSASLIGEPIHPAAWGAAAVVVGCIAMVMKRRPPGLRPPRLTGLRRSFGD